MCQGEGAEQGDFLMPALRTCGQHRALARVIEELRDAERLFACMDDVYVCCARARVAAIRKSLKREMWDHARVRLHNGKTQLWNRGGAAPDGWERLTAMQMQM